MDKGKDELLQEERLGGQILINNTLEAVNLLPHSVNACRAGSESAGHFVNRGIKF